MPTALDAPSSPTVPQILASDNKNLCVRLAQTPFVTPLDLATIRQCDFPGYQPARYVDWQRTDAGGDPTVTILQGIAKWTWDPPAGSQQQIAGVYVTYEQDPDIVSLIGAFTFRTPALLTNTRKHFDLRITLAGYYLAASDGPQELLQLGADFTAFAGDAPNFGVHGYDRDMLVTLREALTGALRRDADIPDLTNRSTRSRQPLVDPGDTALASACTLLLSRLNTILGV